MSSIEDFRDLVKDQNRAICSMRHMMQKGYSLYLLYDRGKNNTRLSTGQWAVIKNPVPGDKKTGFKLYSTYDEAYQEALKFTWQDAPFSDPIAIELLEKSVRKKDTTNDIDTSSH